jgi:AcrR family transcriptional regulator
MTQGRPVIAERRQLIIDAARTLFATRPYDQVTTSAIAKNAGVAYGLIAHHFDNKRGLYLAVMNEIAVEIAAIHETPPPGDASIADRLRFALRAHVAYIDEYSDGFIALLRGGLGADAEHQAAIERLRWMGAQRILLALGMVEPIPAALRTGMRGWVGYLDEMMIDRNTHHDVDVETVVELAVAAIIATLRAAEVLDRAIVYPSGVLDELDTRPRQDPGAV